MISDDTSAVLALTALTATLSPTRLPFGTSWLRSKVSAKLPPFLLCVSEKKTHGKEVEEEGGVEGHVST